MGPLFAAALAAAARTRDRRGAVTPFFVRSFQGPLGQTHTHMGGRVIGEGSPSPARRRLTACVIAGCVGHASVHCDSGPRAWGSGERARCVTTQDSALCASASTSTGCASLPRARMPPRQYLRASAMRRVPAAPPLLVWTPCSARRATRCAWQEPLPSRISWQRWRGDGVRRTIPPRGFAVSPALGARRCLRCGCWGAYGRCT
jgi:hypothetical protein